MKIRISDRNPKVVFVEGDIFNETYCDLFKLDILAPFLKRRMYIPEEYLKVENRGTDCDFEPCIRSSVRPDRAKQIIETHLNKLIYKRYKRIAICPLAIGHLSGHEADEAFMKFVYEWIEENERKIEFLFIFDRSDLSNIVEQDI